MTTPGRQGEAENEQPRYHRSRHIVTAARARRVIYWVGRALPEIGPAGWLVVAVVIVVVLLGVVLLMTVLVLDSQSSSVAQDWFYQCDSAIGPDTAATSTDTPETNAPASESLAPLDIPTTNPYAGLTFSPGDNPSSWDLACANAMASAPYQLPPLQTIASGIDVDCIRQVALAALGTPSVDPAGLTQGMINQASQINSTGRCQLPAAAYPMSGPPAPPVVTLPPPPVVTSACPKSRSATILLPGTLASQGLCGQRVAAAAISPGDLVFWAYSNNAPTHVGVAVSPSQIVTSDPASGRVVEQAMPNGRDVRVKRVLAGSS
ncbi:hypothetical protein ABIA39_006231 [Nocardia sp. GAS34]|uniref:hypothetical protein n=1 Tax=unclassified Nocardia TaxID=2637762 RepID=UPI003D196246